MDENPSCFSFLHSDWPGVSPLGTYSKYLPCCPISQFFTYSDKGSLELHLSRNDQGSCPSWRSYGRKARSIEASGGKKFWIALIARRKMMEHGNIHMHGGDACINYQVSWLIPQSKWSQSRSRRGLVGNHNSSSPASTNRWAYLLCQGWCPLAVELLLFSGSRQNGSSALPKRFDVVSRLTWKPTNFS